MSGFVIHLVKSPPSNKVIEALDGWESPHMVSHYAASLTFDDALALYRVIDNTDSSDGAEVTRLA